MAQPSNTTTYGPPSRHEVLPRPSPLACVECRRKHLRCDATYPTCHRCVKAQLQCHYTSSRRGGGRKRRREEEQPPTTGREFNRLAFERRISNEVDTDADAGERPYQPGARGEASVYTSSEATQTTTTTAATTASHSDSDPLGSFPYGLDHFYNMPSMVDQPVSTSTVVAATTDGSSTWVDDQALVNLYYAFFHRAHPILVPRHLYAAQHYPAYLRLTVQFIGSHYSTTLSSDTLRTMTARELANDSHKTASMVQSRLLFSIALHARYEIEEAQATLSRAVHLALELGMHRQSYGGMHDGVPTLNAIEEESLRRTWWELFIVDGWMAALHRQTSFKTRAVSADVLLPCEESVYADGDSDSLPEPLSLTQFDARLFTEDELQFSSFSYRIEAVRILARVISITRTHEPHPDEVQAVDNALVGWIHHLPASKSEIVNSFGELDEMMFQANMFIQYASIYLHCPRSDLNLPEVVEIACGQSDLHTSPITTQMTHAIIATDASKQLSSLAALRCPVRQHTPLFICALVLSAMVQLSVCLARPRHCHQLPRERVGLIVGVLKSLTQTWALAQNALRLIRKVACQVLERDALPPTPSSRGVGVVSTGDDSGVDVRGFLDDSTIHCTTTNLKEPWLDVNFQVGGLQDAIHLENSVSYFQVASTDDTMY